MKKNKTKLGRPVGFCNKTTDKIEIFDKSIRALAGSLVSKLSMSTSMGISDANEFVEMRAGYFLKLLLLPVIIMSAIAAVGLVFIGALFGAKGQSNVIKLATHVGRILSLHHSGAQEIVTKLENDFKAVKQVEKSVVLITFLSIVGFLFLDKAPERFLFAYPVVVGLALLIYLATRNRAQSFFGLIGRGVLFVALVGTGFMVTAMTWNIKYKDQMVGYTYYLSPLFSNDPEFVWLLRDTTLLGRAKLFTKYAEEMQGLDRLYGDDDVYQDRCNNLAWNESRPEDCTDLQALNERYGLDLKALLAAEFKAAQEELKALTPTKGKDSYFVSNVSKSCINWSRHRTQKRYINKESCYFYPYYRDDTVYFSDVMNKKAFWGSARESLTRYEQEKWARSSAENMALIRKAQKARADIENGTGFTKTTCRYNYMCTMMLESAMKISIDDVNAM